MTQSNDHKLLVFAGSYAESSASGVYVYQFDEQQEQLTLLNEYGGLQNPTFLNIDAANKRLYAITEGKSAEGAKTGEAAAFAINPVDGTLSLLNRGLTVNGPTCHIQRDASSDYLIVTSYHGGKVGLTALTPDGQIGEQLDTQQHEGRGQHPERQDRPHPHSSMFSPDGRFLYVQDLGLDRIKIYEIDRTANELSLLDETQLHPGAGPRHLAFHPSIPYAYVINEVDSSVTVLAYEPASGDLAPIQTISTLPPEGFDGENTTAEITVSPDGRFVYGSNRGHDSIVVYSVDQATGKLSVVEIVSVEGGHPRHFALTPSGSHLIAANRDSNNLVIFRINRDNGRITYTGNSATVSKPVFVQPVAF
ncbi:lactonase family protein [Paenibacillus sp. MMS18-CY102]|uniref:lactonase family protein n=1 Tax=Paenibacillus sp. MMS18-CY102 TaxID=2682849 RepID=UPI0013663D1F|nr:lactonase family protein [Paenibacillus sp. MMS18-CY102]MWC27950.1 beta-propeller fold lactonase family protein [Paenibacillus sp. MMS18-CY102]